MMEILSFDDLLLAARARDEPQRLLFVFAGAELPDDSTPEERARFEAGEGGALTPLMCADKSPEELTGFDALALESRQFGRDWVMVFVAALAGRGGRVPTTVEAEPVLATMVEAIKAGRIGEFIPFDRQGQSVVLG